MRGVVVWLLILPAVLADLPVHCLHSQVVGKWMLYADEGGMTKDVSCGHSMPDRDEDHKDHELRLSTDKPRVIEVDLQEPSVVTMSDGQRGHWTMIYDEGFEIVIGGFKYFAFSHYHSSPTDLGTTNINDCDRTFVGWYHDLNGTNWGCYYGIKQGAVPLSTTPVMNRMKLSSEQQWAKNVDVEHVVDGEAEVPKDMHSFLELINTSQSSFTVKYHDHFRGKSFEELRMLAGNSFLQTDLSISTHEHSHAHSHAHAHSHSHAHSGLNSRTTSGSFNISEMPRSWDWRNVNGQNFDSPFKYQGFCGSCYSMATVQMLETRIRIQTNNTHRPILSSQDAVSCSRYNQGCDGGYPFLVSKYSQDFGIVPEQCFPYSPGTDCARKCSNPKFRVFTSDYYYVGGFYGGCSEAAMVQELYENGPFVVSFNAGSDFMFYSGGVYTSSKYSDSFLEISQDTRNASVRTWEKTTHSVLLVGYGETPSDGKYWIAKNTWGAQWGESGYFRIRRGTDESAFESMSLAAKPIFTIISEADEPPQIPQAAPVTDKPLPSENAWNDANLLQEGEGDSPSQETPTSMDELQSQATGSSDIQGLEKELAEFNNPDYQKQYASIRHPPNSNDMGVNLHASKIPDYTPQTQKTEHHHHHHHHHHHKDGAHHSSDAAHSLIESLQLDEGAGDFADPASD
eukprot:c7250_g1_i1.p1 GENE.c7250_g1_i1~~c7250_g1_i1.p1  ORF type:complete len:697 (+),score=151.41 c7250_g1_i1:54-2093(+)